MFVPDKPFQPSLKFESKACGQSLCGASESCFNQIISSLSLKHQTRQEIFARDKHSSFLQKLVNYRGKRFYNIRPNNVGAILVKIPFDSLIRPYFNQ